MLEWKGYPLQIRQTSRQQKCKILNGFTLYTGSHDPTIHEKKCLKRFVKIKRSTLTTNGNFITPVNRLRNAKCADDVV